jgi:DNA-directed RNA polymerase subunit K/omega
MARVPPSDPMKYRIARIVDERATRLAKGASFLALQMDKATA